MSMSMREQPRAELELQARYVMLTGLAEDRRILDLAAEARGLLLLAEAGAAELTGAADDPERLRRELADAGVEGVDVVPRPGLPLPFADAAFDLVLFPDLAAALLDDETWLTELRRILAADGYLVLALANPNGRRLSDLVGATFAAPLTYEEAFARLSPTFGSLTVFAQSPLVANLFYDLESSEEDPGLVFDRSLLDEDTDEAGWYLLVFGPTQIHRDDLAIVQVPYAPVLQAVRGQPVEQALAVASVEADQRAEAELRAEKEELAARVLSLQDELVRRQREVRALEERLAQPAADAPPPSAEDALRQRIAELEALGAAQAAEMELLRERLTGLKTERQELEERLNRAREQLATVTGEHGAATAELELWRPRIVALKEERAVLEARAQELRQRLAAIEQAGAADGAALQGLRDQLSAVQAERDAVQAERDAVQAERDTAQAERDAAQAERDAAQAERDAAAAETDLLRQQWTALTAAHEQAATALAEAGRDGAELKSLRAEVLVLRERLASLKADREREQAKLSALRAESLARGDQSAADAQQRERMRERIKALKLDRRVVEERLAQLRARHLALVREHEALQAAQQLLAQRGAALRDERDALQASLSQLRQQHLTGEAERQEAGRRLQLADSRVSALKEERDQLAATLHGARQRALASEQRAEQVETALAALQAERDQQVARLAGLGDEHDRVVRRLEERLAAAEQAAESAARADGRVAELEAELGRQAHDRASFESQIKDLLEETAELRDAAEGQKSAAAQLAALTTERDGLQESVRQEKVRSEKLREDLARLHSKLGSVEAENRGLAAEVQRLTDALHDAQNGAAAPVSVHDAETVVMASPLLPPKVEAAPAKPTPRRDSVGRPLEDLDEIEDLLAGAVPPPPTRR